MGPIWFGLVLVLQIQGQEVRQSTEGQNILCPMQVNLYFLPALFGV